MLPKPVDDLYIVRICSSIECWLNDCFQRCFWVYFSWVCCCKPPQRMKKNNHHPNLRHKNIKNAQNTPMCNYDQHRWNDSPFQIYSNVKCSGGRKDRTKVTGLICFLKPCPRPRERWSSPFDRKPVKGIIHDRAPKHEPPFGASRRQEGGGFGCACMFRLHTSVADHRHRGRRCHLRCGGATGGWRRPPRRRNK